MTAKEQAVQSQSIVRMDRDTAWLTDAKGQETMFKYTHCFNSAEADAEDYAVQKDVYDRVGAAILDNALEGFNACLLAYGQTGVPLLRFALVLVGPSPSRHPPSHSPLDVPLASGRKMVPC